MTDKLYNAKLIEDNPSVKTMIYNFMDLRIESSKAKIFKSEKLFPRKNGYSK